MYTMSCSLAVASAPTNLTAVQEGPTGIQVSSTPPTPLGDTTGYRIFYHGGRSGNVNVSGGSADNHLLTGLQNVANYNISIYGIAEHLPSYRVHYPNMILLGEPFKCVIETASIIVFVHPQMEYLLQ